MLHGMVVFKNYSSFRYADIHVQYIFNGKAYAVDIIVNNMLIIKIKLKR